MSAVLRLLLQLAGLAKALIALWTMRRERAAGREEAITRIREANDAAIARALEARARRRIHDAGDGGLRADDGFRRD